MGGTNVARAPESMKQTGEQKGGLVPPSRGGQRHWAGLGPQPRPPPPSHLGLSSDEEGQGVQPHGLP